MNILTERLRTDNLTLAKYIFNTNSGVGIKPDINNTGPIILDYYCDTYNIPSQQGFCNNPKAKSSWQDWITEIVRGSWKERIDG